MKHTKEETASPAARPEKETHTENDINTHVAINICSIQRKMWRVPGRMCAVCRLNCHCVHFWIRDGETHTVHTECLLLGLQADKHTWANLGLTLQTCQLCVWGVSNNHIIIIFYKADPVSSLEFQQGAVKVRQKHISCHSLNCVVHGEPLKLKSRWWKNCLSCPAVRMTSWEERI